LSIECVLARTDAAMSPPTILEAPSLPQVTTKNPSIALEELALFARFSRFVRVNPDLDRRMVSFQGNRNSIGYRWFRYKEGFSATLVDYVLDQLSIQKGPVLDPFAGSGTTLFASSTRGIDAVGIELLPNCAELFDVRTAATR